MDRRLPLYDALRYSKTIIPETKQHEKGSNADKTATSTEAKPAEKEQETEEMEKQENEKAAEERAKRTAQRKKVLRQRLETFFSEIEIMRMNSDWNGLRECYAEEAVLVISPTVFGPDGK